MPRRKTHTEQGLSLDSLMDALTNVVALLVVILVLIQTGVSQKVFEWVDDLAPASELEVSASKIHLEEIEKELSASEDALNRLSLAADSSQDNDALIISMQEEIAEKKIYFSHIDTLEKERAKADSEHSKILAQQAKKQAEVDGLQSQLAVLPDLMSVVPTKVRIPQNRAAPENARKYYALVRGDRIHFMDPEASKDLVRSELKKNYDALNYNRKKIKGANGDYEYVYDRLKTSSYFRRNPIVNDRGQSIGLFNSLTSVVMLWKISPDYENGGVTLAELQNDSNAFQDVLLPVADSGNGVLVYEVHPDGYETYLKAREISDELKISAGWVTVASGIYDTNNTLGLASLIEVGLSNQLERPSRSSGRRVEIEEVKVPRFKLD